MPDTGQGRQVESELAEDSKVTFPVGNCATVNRVSSCPEGIGFPGLFLELPAHDLYDQARAEFSQMIGAGSA
jgi:hypothetical protein